MTIDWSGLRVVRLADLSSLPRGDPWLSAGLLDWGGTIGVPTWMPGGQLHVLHIACPSDLALFGIDASNYGRLVYTPAAWAEAFGREAPAPPWAEPRRPPAH